MIVIAKSSTMTKLLLLLFSCRAEPEGPQDLGELHSVWFYSLKYPATYSLFVVTQSAHQQTLFVFVFLLFKK